MLTVSRFRKADAFLASVSSSGFAYNPCICLSFSRNTERIGIPPVTYGGDFAGNHACSHKNLHGHISLMPSLPVRVTAHTYYNSPSCTTTTTINRKEYQANSQWFTDFINVGENLPYYLYKDEWVNLSGSVYHRKWWGGVRWKGNILYLDNAMQQWYASGKFHRYSWTGTMIELNNARTQYRVSGYNLGREYDASYFPPFPTKVWTTITNASKHTLLTDGPSLSDFLLDAPQLWRRYELILGQYEVSPNKLIWEKLSLSAAENSRTLDINTPMYLADFLRFKDTILSSIGPLKALAEKRVPTWEEIRSAGLSWIYGLKLTFLDSLEASRALRQQVSSLGDGTSWVHARDSDSELVQLHGLGTYSARVERNFNLKFYYNPIDEVVFQNIKNMFDLDVFPTLENVWDLVPFSFVVDWFLTVGSALEAIDFNTYTSVLRIKSVIRTTRCSTTVPFDAIVASPTSGSVQGSIQFIRYERRLERELPRPYSRIGLSNPFRHWAEGGLLFLRSR